MDLNTIAEELFSKVRGRFPSVTIGDGDGNVTNEPAEARYYEFTFDKTNDNKISISLSEDDGVVIMYADSVTENEIAKGKWYEFLREMRMFSKKRMLNFDVRNITKSNLKKRDYQYLATNSGDNSMNESKLYGTSKMSYQDMDNARLVIKHTESVDQEVPAGRTRNISAIYIENNESGERFKYPFKHLAGARAMARHVAEGGTTYDDFGEHIVGLSEELSKLRKFKNYMGRSKVMAESLAEYMGVVHERIGTVKKRIDSLQKPGYYKEAYEGFEKPVFEEIPEDVKENWIDQLTIRQFNEELKDVFPYIYKLIGEGTRAKELGPDDFMSEDETNEAAEKIACLGCDAVSTKAAWKKNNDTCPKCKKSSKGVAEDSVAEGRRGNPDDDGYADYKRDDDRYSDEAPDPIEDDDDDVEEGIGRKFNKLMGFGDKKPKDIQKRVRAMTDDQLKMLAKDVGEKPGDGSERGLQMKLINQELKRRYGIKPGKDVSEDEDPCWDNYKQVGMKKKNGKEVPNCVPEEQQIEAYFEELMGEWADQPISEMSPEELANMVDKRGPQESPKEYIKRKYEDLKKLSAEVGHNAEKDLIRKIAMQKDQLKQAYELLSKKESAEAEDDAVTEQKSPLSEFILSFYDRASGSFPKGETAILTMVEKDYGDEFIEPAKTFIERVNQTFEQYNSSGMQEPAPAVAAPAEDSEFDRIRQLAGL